MTEKVKVSQEELAAKVDVTDWFSLRAHLERGRVILVDALLDLGEVGSCLAEDNVKAIERWVASGLIGKPASHQIEAWDQEKHKVFNCLIISPFVLIQEIPEASA